MAMMTAEQYEESLEKLNLVVYMFGERVEDVVGNPISRNSEARWCFYLCHIHGHKNINWGLILRTQLLTPNTPVRLDKHYCYGKEHKAPSYRICCKITSTVTLPDFSQSL